MNIDWFTFAAQIVNFLILIYLLKRFLYAPITGAMQEREDRINARLEEAEQQQREAERVAEDYRERSEHLESQRRTMLEETKVEVDTSRKQLLAQAKQDVDHRRQEWIESLDRERTTLLQTIRQRCNSQIMAATRRAIQELADTDLESQLVGTFLRRLSSETNSVRSDLALQTSSAGERSVSANSATEQTNQSDANVYTAFELSTEWRERLANELKECFSVGDVHFHNEPEIVCGIEIHIGDQKIGWSVDEFLATLSDELDRLLEQPT